VEEEDEAQQAEEEQQNEEILSMEDLSDEQRADVEKLVHQVVSLLLVSSLSIRL